MTFEYQQVAVTSNLAKFGHFRVEVPIFVTLWGKDHLMDACESLHVILWLAQKYFKNALVLFHGIMFHYRYNYTVFLVVGICLTKIELHSKWSCDFNYQSVKPIYSYGKNICIFCKAKKNIFQEYMFSC